MVLRLTSIVVGLYKKSEADVADEEGLKAYEEPEANDVVISGRQVGKAVDGVVWVDKG